MTLTTFEDIFFPEKVHILKSKKIPDVKRFHACSYKGGSFLKTGVSNSDMH